MKYVLNNQMKTPDLQVKDGFIYKRTDHADGNELSESFGWKLWIPQTLTTKIIEVAHCPPNKCHGGIAKTLARLRQNFYWPNMSSNVKDYIANCLECKAHKSPNQTLKPPITYQ